MLKKIKLNKKIGQNTLLKNGYNYKFKKNGEIDYNTIEKSIKINEYIALFTFKVTKKEIECNIEIINTFLAKVVFREKLADNRVDKFNKIHEIMDNKKCIQILKVITLDEDIYLF